MLDHFNSKIIESALEDNIFSEKTKVTKALSHRNSSFDHGLVRRANYDHILGKNSSNKFESKL